jgi:hypothetical protein
VVTRSAAAKAAASAPIVSAQAAACEPQRPHRHASVEQAEEQAGADQPELRHEQQREGDGDDQRAEVVEGQHLRDQVRQAGARIALAAHLALEDAHHERDLQADQRAHQQHQRVEREAERGRGQAVQREQRRRHQPADGTHQQLDAQEMRDQLTLEETRQVGAHPHREQVGADDSGELQDRVAEQVARERARGKLVDQPAGGHDEHRCEQRHLGGAHRQGRRGRGGARLFSHARRRRRSARSRCTSPRRRSPARCSSSR